MHVAIIGAGISGLACADALVASRHRVTLFDKGRGPGGGMSTRPAPVGDRSLQFDYGAQYFTKRDPGFVAQIREWETTGVAVRWPRPTTTPGSERPA